MLKLKNLKKKLILMLLLGAIMQPVLKAKTLLFIGDSLTEGLGVSQQQSFPFLVKQQLLTQGFEDLVVIVDGVSGSTSSTSLSRLKLHLKKQPDYLFLALGANDGLRGLSTKGLYKNLENSIELALQNNMVVMLAGMHVPTNYGLKYSKEFRQVYEDLKNKYKNSKNFWFLDFLLEDVALNNKLNQSDGLHPNKEGHEVIAENVGSFIKKVLAKTMP